MVVVADTGPINYLVLIGQGDLLGSLYEEVLVPSAVRYELLSPRPPQVVREYIRHPPSWLSINTDAMVLDPSTEHLDPGKREAIQLAESKGADRVVIDDLIARHAAVERGLIVIGTLGVLRDGARRNLLHLQTSLASLQHTSFNVSAELIP